MFKCFLKYRQSLVSWNEHLPCAVAVFLKSVSGDHRQVCGVQADACHRGLSYPQALFHMKTCQFVSVAISQAGFTYLSSGIQDCFTLTGVVHSGWSFIANRLLGWLRNIYWIVQNLPSEKCGVFPALSVANQREQFYGFILTTNVLVSVYRDVFSGKGSMGTKSLFVNCCRLQTL